MRRSFEKGYDISIHSLRMEGDRQIIVIIRDFFRISIHSLRMEGDVQLANTIVQITIFQSTPSAWRETSSIISEIVTPFISIHSLRMEGDSVCLLQFGF